MTIKLSRVGFSAIVTATLVLSACGSSGSDGDTVQNDASLNNELNSELNNDLSNELSEESTDVMPADNAVDPAVSEDQDDNSSGNPVAATNLPEDCGIITIPNGARFCISAGDDRRLFSLNESGDVNFSTTLPENLSFTSTRIFSGTNLYVLNPTTTDSNNWVVTAIDAGGNLQFTSSLGNNIAGIENGFSIAPFLILHAISPAGESRIIQIDETTGDTSNTLNLAGQSIDRVGSESFDGATFISIVSNGQTTYRDSERLEPYARGFTLSPDTLQSEFANLMNITRANYLAQFIDIFNQTNAFAGTTSARTTLPCAVGGTVEVLPESSFFFVNDITRAYSYVDCVLIDRTINGTIIYQSLTTPLGNNVTEISESLSFDSTSISRLLDNTEVAGTFSNELFEVTATLNNEIRVNDGDTIIEINRDVTTNVNRYSQSSANVELVTITDSTYQNKTNQLLQATNGVASARESGSMNLQTESGLSISLEITEPLFYEVLGEQSQGEEVTAAPLAGLARVRSSDGSALDVNANLAGIDMQNYLLNQAGMETSIDGSWNVSPINIRPSLIELP